MLGQPYNIGGKPYTRITLYQHKINFKSLKLSDLRQKLNHVSLKINGFDTTVRMSGRVHVQISKIFLIAAKKQ